MSGKTCFVVMGFQKKTDFETGRTLDLDKTYRNIIKPAVEECGLVCIRADEIPHSGVIDVEMYRLLLDADVVVADLSTANANALYELGVRHALRPFSTIVIAESRLKYPFDVNHTVIRSYQHLGEDIGYDEVMRFRGVLKDAITAILSRPAQDSPVYTYLPGLAPPRREPGAVTAEAPPPPAASAPASGATQGILVGNANAAIEKDDFAGARALLSAAWAMRRPDQPWTANDDYLVQRIAFATYKSQAPTPQAALAEAQEWLARLRPETSNDTETLALWAAVQKRLWDLTEDRAHLDAAVRAYERGFSLRNDFYNGINLAFLLNVRASVSPPAEAIADWVHATRVRREVVDICHRLLRGETDTGLPGRPMAGSEASYWIEATLAEAFQGLGDPATAQEHRRRAAALPVPEWMRRSTDEQLARLESLLARSPLQHLKP